MRFDQTSAKCEVGAAGQSFSVLKRQFGENYCKYGHLREFFISRPVMTECLAEVWNKWFEQYGRVQEACSLAMSVLTVDEMWTNVEFLSLMQALEGLHRALFNGKNLTLKKRLMALVALLPDAVPYTHEAAYLWKNEEAAEAIKRNAQEYADNVRAILSDIRAHGTSVSKIAEESLAAVDLGSAWWAKPPDSHMGGLL